MASEFSDKTNHQQESALAGISDSILLGVTKPIESLSGNDLSEFREGAKEYLKEGLKTAAMFMRGKTGLISTIATQSLDEWKPADSKHQVVDITLGAAKGAALTYIFRKTAMVDSSIKFFPKSLNVPLNAAKLGLLSRIPSVGLTRSTWTDENDNFDAKRTANILLASTASIGTDIFAGVATHGLLKGANRLTDNAVATSPMLSTILTGSGFGMSNGAASEFLLQQQQQQDFDLRNFNYGKIMQAALIQGAVDSIAAIPGGHQAESEALKTFNSMNAGSAKATKIPSLKRDDSNSSHLKKSEDSSNHNDNCSMCLAEEDLSNISIVPQADLPPSALYGRVDKQGRSLSSNPYFDSSTGKVHPRLQQFEVYIARDHDLPIRVPASYELILQEVRQMRLAEETNTAYFGNFTDSERTTASLKALSHMSRTLPEDLIPHLDALPNSTLVRSIHLLDAPSPWDSIPGRDKYGIIMADANVDGHINYYESYRDPESLRSTTNHEFGHLVHFKLEAAKTAFDAACVLEDALNNKKVNARGYALKNESENFAVHFGEELLDPSPEKMLRAVNYAPLRMAVLAKALKSTLIDIPQAKTSLYHEQYLNRATLLENKLVPAVVEQLLKNLGKRPEQSSSQLEALAFIDQAAFFRAAKTIKEYGAAIKAIEIGLDLHANDRTKQVEFLLDVSAHTPNQLLRELAIEKFSREEITELESTLQPLRKLSAPLYIRRLNDMSYWFERNGLPVEAETYAQHALNAHNGKASPEALLSIDMLVNHMLDQQRYQEAEQLMRRSVDMSTKLNGNNDLTTRSSVARLSDYLRNEERFEEAIPFIIRQITADRKLAKTLVLPDKVYHLNQIKEGLVDLCNVYEHLGQTKQEIYWLKQLHKQLDGNFEFDLHRKVIGRLLTLLPVSQCQEFIDKALYLDKVMAGMNSQGELVSAR